MEQEIQPQSQQPINPIPPPVRKINKKTIVIIVLAILAMVIGYYGWRTFTIHYDKLGELSFYKDANMELKVVLIHENLPLHYVGNSYSVACQSQNTQAPSNDEYEWKFDRIEKGWNATPQAYLGNGLGSDSNTLLKSLSEEAKKLYLVKDKNTLVILANPNVYISFDGCRTFSNWILKNNISPGLLVESTPEFEKCAEQQKKDKELGLTSYGNCSDLKLTGKGQPVFQDIVANDNGHASFKVTSPAFKDNRIIGVETNDFGKTWKSIVSTSGLTQLTEFKDALITLERTVCYGFCPAYEITIHGDGKVVYNGKNFVKIKGIQNSQISKDKVRELIDSFNKLNYFSLQDKIGGPIPDAPWTITSITINNQTKKVEDYYGAPKELIELENKIDEVTNSKNWIGKCTSRFDETACE